MLNLKNFNSIYGGVMFKYIASATYGNDWLDKAIIDHAKLSRSSMAQKAYEDSEMHQAFVVNGDSLGYSFTAGKDGDDTYKDDRPERIIKSFFTATSTFLADKIKNGMKERALALILTDVAGNFKFAAIVQYQENENPDEPGNWNYTMTFDEEDVNDIEKDNPMQKILYNNESFRPVFRQIAYDVGCIEFEHDTYMYDACLLVIDTLLQILDREAKEGDTETIELSGYFIASVKCENDEKTFAIDPDGQQKSIINNHEKLEV